MYRVGIAKLTSCSGCINEVIYALTFRDIVDKYRVEYFTEVLDVEDFGEVDIVFVEGSISNKHQEEFVKNARAKAEFLVAIGTCALMGGVQSLRSGIDVEVVKRTVYPEPRYIDIYSDVKPVTDIVKVDLVIPGCPVNGDAVASLLRKYSLGGLPIPIYESVCGECKRKRFECVLVAKGIPCLGPITISGCGAICPSFGRGCYGCYGIKYFDIGKENIELFIKHLEELGLSREDVDTLLKGYGFKVYLSLTKGEKK